MNQEAEALLLAGILRKPDAYWSINDVGLTYKDFLGKENRRIMRAIGDVAKDKREPEMPFVLEEVKRTGNEQAIDYLQKLLSLPCSTAQAKSFARTVKGLSTSRQLASAGANIIEIAKEKRAESDEAIAEAESLLRNIRRELPHMADSSPEPADILGRLRNSTREVSVPIRFSETLQMLTGGLIPGHLWVVGGFSSVGKSAVACNFIADTLRHGRWAGLVSTEMTQEQYMIRLLSLFSNVPQHSLRDRVVVGFEQSESLKRAEAELARANLRIFDTLYRSVDIRSKAIQMKETTGLDVLLVDFIQNVRGTVGDYSFGDMTEVILDLQQMAKELDMTVIAFSQLSNEMAKRQAEGESNDFYAFKGSGAIKDAADFAVILRRDRVRHSPVLDFEVVKNRHGEMRVVSTHMDLPTGRIEEPGWDTEEYEDV